MIGSGPRSLLVAIVLLQLVVASLPWWHLVGDEGRIAVSGNLASAGVTQALAIIMAGSLLVTLSVGARGRRIIGAFIAVAQLAVVALGVSRPRPSDADLGSLLASGPMVGTSALQGAIWPWLYAALGALGVAGALWLVRRPVTDSSRPVPDGVVRLADSLDSWKAMDEGLDPTEEPQEERR